MLSVVSSYGPVLGVVAGAVVGDAGFGEYPGVRADAGPLFLFADL